MGPRISLCLGQNYSVCFLLQSSFLIESEFYQAKILYVQLQLISVYVFLEKVNTIEKIS